MHKFGNPLIGLTLAFTNECVDLLMNNRRDKSQSERGGLLFAAPVVDELIIVSKASLPTRKDRSGKYYFRPDPASSQAKIDHQFKNGLAYVGDWHTHPTTLPRPSPKDIVTIKSIFCNSTHSLNYALMVIIGTSDKFWDNYFCLTNGLEVYELS